MSKKLKSNKKPLDAKTLANLVIEEIKEHKECSLSVLEKMQQAFGSKKAQREAFIDIINKKLDNKQLHILNKAVMKNTNELLPENDSAFLCREPKDKIFQQLLLLEAKRHGMKANFNTKDELQPVCIKDIPQEILNHYSILIEKFYPQRNSADSLNTSIAKSINFLFYAPLFRESGIYEKLGTRVAGIEHEIQNPDSKFIKNLADEQLEKHVSTKENLKNDKNEEKEIHIKENSENKKNEEKEAKIFSIIEESVLKLQQSKELVVKDQQQERIKKHLSKFLEEISGEMLIFKKNDLINIIHQELSKNQSKWSKFVSYLGIKSYGISDNDLEKIGKEINDKVKNFDSPISKPEIQRQLKQIKKELSGLNNPTLHSEIKKNKLYTKAEAKPPIPKKPKNLKSRAVPSHE